MSTSTTPLYRAGANAYAVAPRESSADSRIQAGAVRELLRPLPGCVLSRVALLGEMSGFLRSRELFAPHPPKLPLLPQGEKGEFGRSESQNERRNVGREKECRDFQKAHSCKRMRGRHTPHAAM